MNLKPYLNRRFLIVLLLGFSSGLPLALTGTTLQAWFTQSGVDIVAIGFLALVGQPYVYKFLWSPLIDRVIPPLFGRRRGWMLITQMTLVFSLASIAFCSPVFNPKFMAGLALAIAFFSASQDISIDAYRTDLLEQHELGFGAAIFVGSYRVAMLVAGGLALIFAAEWGWRTTYLIMSGLMFVGIISAWFAPETDSDKQLNGTPMSWRVAIIEPFQEFITRKNAWIILAIIILYNVGYACIYVMSMPFLLRGLGFSLLTIGSIYKTVSLVAILGGTFVGGMLMMRMGMFRALFIFGILQALSNLTFMALAIIGKSLPFMIFAVFADNWSCGMATAAFMAFLMYLCDGRYTATQFALFSALAAIARVYVGPLAGVMVEHMGWAEFFFYSSVFCLPGIALLWWMREGIAAVGLSAATSR